MLNWIRKLVEKRQGDYSSQVLNNAWSNYTDISSNPLQTAAVESAAGLYQLSFQAAEITPKNNRTQALTPQVMGQIGRNMILRGESLYLISVMNGMVKLFQCSYWDVIDGTHDPDTWLYRIVLNGANGSITKVVGSEEVLHFRYSENQEYPWRGISPLARCKDSAKLFSYIEQRLSEEASSPSALLLPIPKNPDPDDEDDADTIADDIAGAKGKPVILETTSGGYGDRTQAPNKDWEQKRVGFTPEEVSRKLRMDVEHSIYNACQIPAALVSSSSDGTANREAYRRFGMLTIQNLLNKCGHEIAMKLDVMPTFDLGSIWAHDLAGRSMAFQKLVAGGMSPGEAASISGLMVSDD